MSRIQDILNRAERDGTVRRTRGLTDERRPAPLTSVAPRVDYTAPSPPWTPEATAPSLLDGAAPASRTAPDARLDSRLVAATASHSLAAEQFRALRTRIKRAENGQAVRALVITSPAKGDGKSLTAANLALTMARNTSSACCWSTATCGARPSTACSVSARARGSPTC
jgi:hypothetical protein